MWSRYRDERWPPWVTFSGRYPMRRAGGFRSPLPRRVLGCVRAMFTMALKMIKRKKDNNGRWIP